MKKAKTNTTSFNTGEIIIYQSANGNEAVEVHLADDTVWLSQAQMQELFSRERSVITKHINNIFKEGELKKIKYVQNLHILLQTINHSYELASYATPELRGLFNDWLGEIELRVINFVNHRNRIDPQELSSYFKLTTESIIFVLGKLARKGKSTTHLRLLKREE